ncbi:MAG: zf-HC2 domain-containing protein [Vicinamibacterales bacterium]
MIDGDDRLDNEPAEPSTGGGSPCPDDASLSLYIDGQLDETSRGRIRDHLDHCDDCRELLATAVQAHLALSAGLAAPAADPRPAAASAIVALPAEPVSGVRRALPPWLWAAAAAAALVLAVRLGGGPAPLPDTQAAAAWREIAESVGSERTLEPRLSRLPDYVPLAPPLRGDGTSVDFQAETIARRLSQEADAATDPAARLDARHAAAIATLLAGDRAGALRGLEQVAADAPERDTRAAVLADLAAARLANGQPSEALAAAREALEIDPANPAARFNEALALERSGQTDEAARAWRAVAADPTQGAPWQDEARRHLHPAEGR